MNQKEIKDLFSTMTDEQASDLILSKACKHIGPGETDVIKVLNRCIINLDVVKELGELSPERLFKIHKDIMKKLEIVADEGGYLIIEESQECSCNECIYISSDKED